MKITSIQQNPYESLYRSSALPRGNLSKREAEELVRHLGLIYNTFGIVMKDFIRLVGSSYDQKSQNISAASKAKREVKPVQFIKRPPEQPNNEDQWWQQSTSTGSQQHQDGRGIHKKNARSKDPIKSSNPSTFFSLFSLDQSSSSSSFAVSLRQRQRQKMAVREKENIYDKNVGETNLPKETSGSSIFDQRSQLGKPNNAQPLRYIPGRKKEERAQFPGVACPQCYRYYQAMRMDIPNLCDCSSRHRSNVDYHPKKITNKRGRFSDQMKFD